MNSLLDKLQSLFSKSFVVSSFLPVLVCAFINASLLYATSERFREFVRTLQPKGSVAAVLQGGATLFALAVIANVIAPLIPFFREVLEGQHWPDWLRQAFVPHHSDRLARCEAAIRMVKHCIAELSHEPGRAGTTTDAWLDALADAAGMPATGRARKLADLNAAAATLSYAELEVARTKLIAESKNESVRAMDFRSLYAALMPLLDDATPASADSAMEKSRSDLQIALASQKHGEAPSFEVLESAKRELATELKDARPATFLRIKEHYEEFVRLLDEAVPRLESELIDLTNERQRRWGRSTVAPTELGNLVNAVSAYGLVRYGFSLEIGWSRLQKVMQKDTAQLDILQEVKSQFDAAIALFWMIAATTLFWSGRLLFGYSVPLFLAVAIGGTLACNLLYRVAVSSYLSCGDLLRSCVDLYRFDLLTALHLPLPAGADAERKTWDLLRSQSEFGESVDVAYEHKPKVAE